jgi:hypothetical protein
MDDSSEDEESDSDSEGDDDGVLLWLCIGAVGFWTDVDSGVQGDGISELSDGCEGVSGVVGPNGASLGGSGDVFSDVLSVGGVCGWEVFRFCNLWDCREARM